MRMKALFPLMVALTTIVLLGCPNPATPPTDTVINIAAIPGVTVPVCGGTPVTAITETAQYTGTVSWSPTVSGTFAANTVYTATITLTAKTGYTLTGVAENSFTVAGATATNAVNSGVVTAVFPATGVADYTSANIGTLKLVPAGRFQRDATASNISVITKPYRMSEHEITRAQFLAVMGTDPSVGYSSGTNDPVQDTNWYHAIAFCNKLSIAEGLTPVYTVTGVDFNTLTYSAIPTTSNTDWNNATANWSANGYRLPTEMEWMWAAMGANSDGRSGDIVGGVNTGGYTKGYAGSTEAGGAQVNMGNYAWYESNANGTTHPVGGKTANELGLYDMTGNVWEWCWDWNAAYPTGTQTDYRGAASSPGRVMRGGSWGSNATSCAVAVRNSNGPYNHSINIGFRVVRP
jgi:sulfatase modifying factor 1